MNVFKHMDPPRENLRKVTTAIGAVVSDHSTCSEIGRDILARNGSAVDAAIATLLCDGLMSPHSMGLGGGSFFAIYDATTKKTQTINARESAPAGITFDLDKQNWSKNKALSIGVPGEILAYYEAHKKFGRLPWKELFLPSIHLAENGHYMSYPVSQAFIRLLQYGIDLTKDAEFCRVYCDDTGKIAPEGTLIKRPRLAQTLRGIAEHGPKYLYEGPIADEIIRELQDKGGVITTKDLAEYAPVVEDGISVDLGDVTLLTMGAPSGGPILGLALNILKGILTHHWSAITLQEQASTIHAIIEATKLAQTHQCQLADPAYVPDVKEKEDKMLMDSHAQFLRNEKLDITHAHSSSHKYETAGHGTAHVSVLAPDGSAVSVTSSVNYYFGSTIMSESTGIIWNNGMIDFSKDNARNCVEPGKRPLSSMVPAIFVDKAGDVRLVVGAAGGRHAVPIVTEVSAYNLFLGDTVEQAVRRKRFYHKLHENVVVYEKGFQQDILHDLEARFGHQVTEFSGNIMGVVQAIAWKPGMGEITAFSDERKTCGKAKFLRKTVELK